MSTVTSSGESHATTPLAAPGAGGQNHLPRHGAIETAVASAIDGIAILRDGVFQYLNDAHVRMFDYPDAAALLGQSWRALYCEEESRRLEREVFPLLEAHGHWKGEAIARRRDGSRFIEGLSLTVGDNGDLICVCRDITGQRWGEQLLAAQKQVLELLVREVSLDDILGQLVLTLERLSPGMLGSVLLLEGQSLRAGVAPSLPLSYSRAVDGLPVGEGRGSCGTAAYRREPVIVTDINSDPLWRDCWELAARAGIRACWSAPILDSAGAVLGTFAMHHREPRIPEARERELLGMAANLAALAITRKRTEAALRDSEAHNRALIQALPDLLIRIGADGSYRDFLSGGEVKILNSERGQQPGSHIYEALPREMAEERMRHVSRALATGRLQIYDYAITVDGEVRFEEARVIPYGGDEVLVVVRDISAQKHSEQALQQANRQLRDRLDDLHRHNTEMRLLNEMGEVLLACLSLEEAFATLDDLLTPLFPDLGGALFIADETRQRLAPVSHWGMPAPAAMDFHSRNCWGLRRGRAHLVEGRQTGLRCAHTATDADATMSLCIPMIAQGETFGLFHLRGDSAVALPETTRQLAQAVAERVGLAIANLQLRHSLTQQSIRDPLTGLHNRRHLEEALPRELARAVRQRRLVGVIMLDVDHFKRFNDEHGHAVGDRVLRAVGSLLAEAVREADLACRYGGEEFTVVLPGATLAQTRERAEAIRAAIGALQLDHEGEALPAISASLGVACFPDHGTSVPALVQAADMALYRAKANGRDRVEPAP